MDRRPNRFAGLVGVALCLAGAAATSPEDRSEPVAPRMPVMSATLTRAALEITADVSSETHADSLERFIDDRFPDHDTTLYWRTGTAPDADWQLLTLAALDLMAETSIVRMRLEPGRLDLEGLRPDEGLFDVRLARVAATGGDGFESNVAVAAVSATGRRAEAQDACGTMFLSLRGEPIRFFVGTGDLRPSSQPLLDRYVEFATDCPDSRLAIIGHTDSTGDEAFNLYLSEQRARVVADYLVRAGIPAERVRPIGKGSSDPVGDNGTSWGRSQNRRIEVVLEP